MRKGDWIQTSTGRAFYPLDPRPEEVCIIDIAHALSNLCRFGGHSRHFYSVAEHSYHVSCLAASANSQDLDLQLWGLLHDASEAYLVDVPRPIKPELKEYRAIEENLMRVIAQTFQLSWPMPVEIHKFDDGMLMAEKKALMRAMPPELEWYHSERAADITISCWYPGTAIEAFLRQYNDLERRRLRCKTK